MEYEGTVMACSALNILPVQVGKPHQAPAAADAQIFYLDQAHFPQRI
jgi:hypothetical protein